MYLPYYAVQPRFLPSKSRHIPAQPVAGWLVWLLWHVFLCKPSGRLSSLPRKSLVNSVSQTQASLGSIHQPAHLAGETLPAAVANAVLVL